MSEFPTDRRLRVEWMEERERRKREVFAATPPPASTLKPKKRRKRPCEIVITMRQDKQHLNVRCRCEAPTARRGISRVWPLLAVATTIREATLLWQLHVEEPEEGTIGDEELLRGDGPAGQPDDAGPEGERDQPSGDAGHAFVEDVHKAGEVA